MEKTASSRAPTWLGNFKCCPTMECHGLGSLEVVHCKAFLVSQLGAWITAVKARQNQAINEMIYCFGPPCPALSEAKNCTVFCIKDKHLA